MPGYEGISAGAGMRVLVPGYWSNSIVHQHR